MDLEEIIENRKIEKQNFKKQLMNIYKECIKNYDWNKVADDLINNKVHYVSKTCIGQYQYFTQYECCELFKKLLEIEISNSNFICSIEYYNDQTNSILCIHENTVWNRNCLIS